MSRTLSDENLNPKKILVSSKKPLLNGEKYLVYHQYIIVTNIYLELRQSLSFLSPL